jgi:hypothetical protein
MQSDSMIQIGAILYVKCTQLEDGSVNTIILREQLGMHEQAQVWGIQPCIDLESSEDGP